jgi:Thiol-activated cytolysin
MTKKTLSKLLVCALLGTTATTLTHAANAQGIPGKPTVPSSASKLQKSLAKSALKANYAKLKAMKLESMKMSDLSGGSLKSLTPSEKLALIGNMPNRFGDLKINLGPKQVTGTAANGIKYYMGRSAPSLPSEKSGATSVERGKDDLIVCKTTPIDIARQFAGPLMIAGLPSSQNQSVIYPGALFRDSDVVRGVFTPMNLQRKPGSITIDVFNLNGSVATNVQNLNDRTQVTTGINQLRSGAAGANANTYLEYTEVAFKAGQQLNVDLEASTEANLEAILGVPVSAGVGGGGSLGFEQGVNVAVAALNQVYYTISLGGEGPASTVDGTAPGDALCVTDVQYGRRAFLMVGSSVSRAEASATLNQLLSLSAEGVDLVSAERNLSAEAKLSLELGFVRMTVVGGSVQSAVQVRDLASLRNYIEQIDPSVAGVNAVPIAYTLRYASDNAPAKVGAFADLIDKECFRAKQVKVTLNSIKPTKVVDWGDEELFGHIKVIESGNLASGERTLWSKSSGSAVSGKQGVAINVNESGTFNFNQAVSSDDEVKVEIELNDRIMGVPDPEFAGATAADRDRGYAKYERKTAKASLADIRNAPNGKLTKKFTVAEGDATVEVTLSYELLGP